MPLTFNNLISVVCQSRSICGLFSLSATVKRANVQSIIVMYLGHRHWAWRSNALVFSINFLIMFSATLFWWWILTPYSTISWHFLLQFPLNKSSANILSTWWCFGVTPWQLYSIWFFHANREETQCGIFFLIFWNWSWRKPGPL